MTPFFPLLPVGSCNAFRIFASSTMYLIPFESVPSFGKLCNSCTMADTSTSSLRSISPLPAQPLVHAADAEVWAYADATCAYRLSVGEQNVIAFKNFRFPSPPVGAVAECQPYNLRVLGSISSEGMSELSQVPILSPTTFSRMRIWFV